MKKINSRLLKGIVLPLLFICTASFHAASQTGLQPGDSVPDIWMHSFLHPSQSAINLRRNDKKLVVLDFWSTWCKACIKALTKLDQLQGKLGADIMIIAVTDQDSATVSKFFKKTGMRLPQLPVKTGDSVLKQYFTFQSLPHTVWISDGKVVYVTYGYNVNEPNIRKYLAGDPLKLALKDGDKVYDRGAPIWAKTNAQFGAKPERYSYLTGWLHNYGGVVNRGFYDTASQTIGVRMINVPLKLVIEAAYGQEYRLSNRVSIETAHAKHVVWDNIYAAEDGRIERGLVCYELGVSWSERKQIPQLIQADLNRYLDFKIEVEKRKKRIYVIEQTGLDIVKPSCENKDYHYTKANGAFSFCGSFKSFVMALQNEFGHGSLPIIDRSGYVGNLYVSAKGTLKDIEFVKEVLGRYGFKITEQESEIDMLVMKDRAETVCD